MGWSTHWLIKYKYKDWIGIVYFLIFIYALDFAKIQMINENPKIEPIF